MPRPFSAIKVIDLTHVLAGPFASYQLAVLGADVIKIEDPANPDCARGRGPDPDQNAALRGLNYQVQGAEKRSMTLNLHTERGRQLLIELVGTTDVFVENYRPGKLDALGLGYKDLSSANPALIYCSISGYGGSGPRSGYAAYDNVVQASAGIVARSGTKPALSFVDYATGQTAAFAISAALYQRAHDGRGQFIDCSMYESALMLMAPEVAAARHPVISARGKEAGLGSYATAQGDLMLGVFTPRQNTKFWKALEAEGYDADTFQDTPDWESLWAKSDQMRAALTKILPTRTAEQWAEWMHNLGIPADVIRSLADAVSDPQLSARNFLRPLPAGAGDTVAPVQAAAAAFTFEHDGPDITRAAPGFGEHTAEVLTELGYGSAEIADLVKEGIVR